MSQLLRVVGYDIRGYLFLETVPLIEHVIINLDGTTNTRSYANFIETQQTTRSLPLQNLSKKEVARWMQTSEKKSYHGVVENGLAVHLPIDDLIHLIGDYLLDGK